MKASRPIAVTLVALFLGAEVSAQSIRRPRPPWITGEAIRVVGAIARKRPVPAAVAVTKADEWAVVRDLPQHTAVLVVVRGDTSVAGEVIAADSCGIRVRTSGGEPMTIGREDVREVRVKSPGMSPGTSLGVGALFGGLTGFVIGRAKECACELHGLSTAFGTVSGIAAGTIVGWKLGSGRDDKPSRVIYASEGPTRLGTGCGIGDLQ